MEKCQKPCKDYIFGGCGNPECTSACHQPIIKKTLLLTGAAGFVGSHVLRYLIKYTNYDIVCLVRLREAGDLNRLKDFQENPRIKFVYHDLKYDLNVAVREAIGNIDYIFHLAANSNVDRSISHPREFFEDNVMGTVSILDFLRLHQPHARLINFNTDEYYGPAPDGYKFTEEDRPRPSNPYSGSKVGQFGVGYSYFVTYGLDIINTFTMNIFGSGQAPTKLMPKAIRFAKERKPMPVFAELNGDKLVSVGERHWLHVDNVGEALVFLLENGVKGELYNIVGTDELTNEDVVRAINKLMGIDPLIEYVDFHKTRPGHDRRYAIDGTKMKNLGWEPKIKFEEGIKNVINSLK